MAQYTYSAIERYDVGALDAAIRGDAALRLFGPTGVSLQISSGIDGQLLVDFAEVLDDSGEARLRCLVAQYGAQVAIYQLECVVCQRSYALAGNGRPVYCRTCDTPFMTSYPSGRHVWSDPSDRLRRWAIVEGFIAFGVRLGELPRGGVLLKDVVIQNTSLPEVAEVRTDGFRWCVRVGVISAMWEDTKVQFSWEVAP